jgi:hypothetical protein
MPAIKIAFLAIWVSKKNDISKKTKMKYRGSFCQKQGFPLEISDVT